MSILHLIRGQQEQARLPSAPAVVCQWCSEEVHPGDAIVVPHPLHGAPLVCGWCCAVAVADKHRLLAEAAGGRYSPSVLERVAEVYIMAALRARAMAKAERARLEAVDPDPSAGGGF